MSNSYQIKFILNGIAKFSDAQKDIEKALKNIESKTNSISKATSKAIKSTGDEVAKSQVDAINRYSAIREKALQSDINSYKRHKRKLQNIVVEDLAKQGDIATKKLNDARLQVKRNEKIKSSEKKELSNIKISKSQAELEKKKDIAEIAVKKQADNLATSKKKNKSDLEKKQQSNIIDVDKKRNVAEIFVKKQADNLETTKKKNKLDVDKKQVNLQKEEVSLLTQKQKLTTSALKTLEQENKTKKSSITLQKEELSLRDRENKINSRKLRDVENVRRRVIFDRIRRGEAIEEIGRTGLLGISLPTTFAIKKSLDAAQELEKMQMSLKLYFGKKNMKDVEKFIYKKAGETPLDVFEASKIVSGIGSSASQTGLKNVNEIFKRASTIIDVLSVTTQTAEDRREIVEQLKQVSGKGYANVSQDLKAILSRSPFFNQQFKETFGKDIYQMAEERIPISFPMLMKVFEDMSNKPQIKQALKDLKNSFSQSVDELGNVAQKSSGEIGLLISNLYDLPDTFKKASDFLDKLGNTATRIKEGKGTPTETITANLLTKALPIAILTPLALLLGGKFFKILNKMRLGEGGSLGKNILLGAGLSGFANIATDGFNLKKGGIAENIGTVANIGLIVAGFGPTLVSLMKSMSKLTTLTNGLGLATLQASSKLLGLGVSISAVFLAIDTLIRKFTMSNDEFINTAFFGLLKPIDDIIQKARMGDETRIEMFGSKTIENLQKQYAIKYGTSPNLVSREMIEKDLFETQKFQIRQNLDANAIKNAVKEGSAEGVADGMVKYNKNDKPITPPVAKKQKVQSVVNVLGNPVNHTIGY